MAERFLIESGVEEEVIQSIKKCILTTKNTETPATLLEQIISDADSYYIGTENFSVDNKLRRKEFQLLHNTHVNKKEWRKKTIALLENHQYYTDYCKEHLNVTKTQNLLKLKKKGADVAPSANPNIISSADKTEVVNTTEKKKKGASESPDRTIETMFRTTSSNSQRLSNQADTKAHILISVNAIVISVLLTLVVRKMDEYSKVTIPVIMLLLVNMVTMIFSILATRPNIPKGAYNESDLEQK